MLSSLACFLASVDEDDKFHHTLFDLATTATESPTSDLPGSEMHI
jgi:hypothetical protein